MEGGVEYQFHPFGIERVAGQWVFAGHSLTLFHIPDKSK